MKKEEKQLFKQLCRFRAETFNKNLLRYASPEVLGYLFFNRMQGTAYSVLKKHGCLGAVSREFRNSLKGAYEQNIEKNRSFFRCLKLVSEVLREQYDKYVMLKGAVLCGAYPEGCRTSNDIDLLVKPGDVTVVGEALAKSGFRQGHIRNGEFVPASRKEIIESKLLRGETVPYILALGLPYMDFLEVDINFSLDYKNGDEAVLKAMLERGVYGTGTDLRIPTLCREDFFIHLCVHLYKEAATLPWVEMKRDMTLYKYADIYMLLDDMSEMNVSELFDRARELELEKPCAFAVMQTAELFDLKTPYILGRARDALREDEAFLHRVISPGEKKELMYHTKDITKRFFLDNRSLDLEEVRT